MQENYYEDNAEKFCESTINVDIGQLRERFLKYVQQDGTILDAGCGSGRDSLAFKKQGYTVTAFDASKKMAEIASRTLAQPVLRLTFEEVTFQNEFDGIWACASLLHVPKKNLTDVLCRLGKALAPQGAIYVSFKYGDSERIKDDGRYFVDLDEDALQRILKNCLELQMHEAWITEDHRPERKNEKWLNAILLKKEGR